MLTTRIAPTPSGYLHPGNAVNFLLTDWLAQATGRRLLLRIDDMDPTRVRPAYVSDVFRVLDLLGIIPDGGPRGVVQFSAEHRLDRDYLRSELRRSGLPTYACACSRRELAARPPEIRDPCRERNLPWLPGENAVRLRMEPGATVEVPVWTGSQVTGRLRVALWEQMPDFVLWRRDDLPSYQLASVVADRDLGVDAVVRGADLLASTAAQLLIAEPLGAGAFAAGMFVQHRLLTDPGGGKLSKSQAASPVRADRKALAQVLTHARILAAEVGIPVPQTQWPARGILGSGPRA